MSIDPSPVLATAFFGELAKGDPAPAWLDATVAARWNLGADVRLSLIGVSENASFLIRSRDQPVAVLRLNRPGYLAGSEAVRSEAAWVAAIARDTEVSVAAPMLGRDGEAVQGLRDPEAANHGIADYTGLVSPFVAGTMLEDLRDHAQWFARIGRDTAALHEHARTWRPAEGFARHDWELRHLLGPEARWGRWQDHTLDAATRGVLERAGTAALGVLEHDVRATPHTWGLIHADIRPSNVIVDGDRMTIIDFDDCGYSWFLYDFASALTWMDHLDTAPDLAQRWVAGYREVRPAFTTADATVACALDMVRCLTMLGWCTTHREDALPPTVRGHVVEAAVTVAEAYLASPTWLLD